jgi:hypothetical protein
VSLHRILRQARCGDDETAASAASKTECIFAAPIRPDACGLRVEAGLHAVCDQPRFKALKKGLELPQ